MLPRLGVYIAFKFGTGGGTFPVLGRGCAVMGYAYRPPHPLRPLRMGRRHVPSRPYALYCDGVNAGGYCAVRGGGLTSGVYDAAGGMLRVVAGAGCHGAGAVGGPGGLRV